MHMDALSFYMLLFVVALLYASVGHGGASGYLALMAIFNLSMATMKPSALILNLFVSLTAFIQFYRKGHLKFSIFLPFALASVPLSFLGGLIDVDEGLYKKLLGAFLLLAVVRILFFDQIAIKRNKVPPYLISLFTGALIGFLSGLLGIGGGIILSPILLFFYGTDQKQTAAISALFIFVNSLAGLTGQVAKGVVLDPQIFWYVMVAFCGGLIGSFLGSSRLNQTTLKYILSLVLLLATYKLFNG